MTCAHKERFVSTCDGCLVEMSADRAGLRSENALLKLQNDEMSKRIYQIGLLCDKVPGLEHGFCPDIGEPRDNITRIKIALERFIQKPKSEPNATICHETVRFDGGPIYCYQPMPCRVHGLEKRSSESPKRGWKCAKCGKVSQFQDGLCWDCFGGDPGQ